MPSAGLQVARIASARASAALASGDMESAESPTPADSDLVALRDEMHRKLGRCLVRLQQYELVMKAFVAQHRIEGFATEVPRLAEERAARFATMTLGQVKSEFVSGVFEGADPAPESELEPDDPVWFGTRFSIDLSEDHRVRVEDGLAALVARRNHLVHGFIARHDVWSVEGLPAAIAYLDDAYAEIDQRFRELRGWYEGMDEVYQRIADFLVTEKGRDVLPDGVLVAELREVEQELCEDGWTLLSRAIALIGAKEPGLTPRSQGYASWCHVLHESGRFETRKALTESGTKQIWYRSKV